MLEWISDIFLGAGTDGIVVVHLALGIKTTGATARISALLIDAGQMLSTLRADNTLRSACGGCSKVANLATTSWMPLHSTAYAVRSTRIWFTDADRSNWSSFAAHKRIALKAASTTTCGQVIDHHTLGVGTAGSCAGIAAMLLDASQGRGTLRVVDTFGTTAGAVRISKVRFNTTTTGGIIVWSADCILSTGIGVAGIVVSMWLFLNNLGATHEGVSLVALIAAAVCRMSNHSAARVVSTGIGARVLTLLLNACLVSRTFAAQRTLGTTVGWTTNVVGHTRADRTVLFDLANGVRSTR